MVEDDAQLARPPRLLQQVHGEVLTLGGQLLVVGFELVLQAAEAPQLHAQLEAGQDGVLAGQGDERGAGQSLVGVDARPRVAEAVLRAAVHAVLAAAARVVRFGDAVAAVQQNFDDLIIVPVGGQNDRGDVRCEGT